MKFNQDNHITNVFLLALETFADTCLICQSKFPSNTLKDLRCLRQLSYMASITPFIFLNVNYPSTKLSKVA